DSGSAGHPQHIAFTPLAQLLTKPRVATELIITGDPTMWDVRAPCVEHLQALFLAGLVTHLWRDVACVAPLLVACPFLGEIQPEVEQGMLIITNVAPEDADLAVVDFAPLATPLAFDPDRMGAELGETTRIEGDNAIGLAQAMDHLRHQHFDQRAMIPWRSADECLQDLSLDIDERGDVFGIFPGQVRQQPLEIEVQVALSGLGLQRLSVGYDERGQTVDHRVEDVRGNDAVAQQLLSPLCPRQCHLFASWICPANGRYG